MDTVLIDEWLDGAEAVPVIDGASVAVVRNRVREEIAAAGLPPEIGAKLVNVASELAQNQLSHARLGSVGVVRIERGGVPGLEVRAVDGGAGILDPARALRGGHSTAGTLGIGLAAVRELAREVDVDVRREEGTCVRARVFASEVPRWREVGVFARPYPGERVSGDGAFTRRTARGLLAAVVDGLGHGEEAREATDAALRALRAAPDDAEPRAIVEACHAAAASTRGVVIVVARIDPQGELSLAGVGNAMAYVVGPRAASRFTGAAAVVGAPGPLRRVATERRSLTAYDALLLFSDGVSSRLSLEDDLALLHEPPVVVAQRAMERFARDNDDATVLVAR